MSLGLGPRFSKVQLLLVRLLCGVIGNTADSGSVVLGSNPSRGIKHRLFLLNGNYWFDSNISPLLARLLQPALILGCSYIGLVLQLCTLERGVRLPYGQLIFCEFLTQHRRVMRERENKQSSSSKRKEELVTTFADKQKILYGLKVLTAGIRDLQS